MLDCANSSAVAGDANINGEGRFIFDMEARHAAMPEGLTQSTTNSIVLNFFHFPGMDSGDKVITNDIEDNIDPQSSLRIISRIMRVWYRMLSPTLDLPSCRLSSVTRHMYAGAFFRDTGATVC